MTKNILHSRHVTFDESTMFSPLEEISDNTGLDGDKTKETSYSHI